MCNLISCHNRFPLPHRKCTRQINGFQLAVLLSQRHMPSSLCSADLDPASDPGRVSYYASALTHDRGLQGTRNQKKVSRSRFSRAGQLDLQLSVKKGATMTPFPAAREQGVDFFFFCSFFSLVQWCHIRAVELSGRWTESNMSRTYPFTIWKKMAGVTMLASSDAGPFYFSRSLLS